MAVKDKKSKKNKADKVEAPKVERAPRKKKEATVCECDAYTGCGATSVGRFAPGHDAKLISRLVDDAVDGSQEEAEELFERVFGANTALFLKAQKTLANRLAKEQAKEERAEARAAAKAAKPKKTAKPKRSFEPVEAQIKIGRRKFDAVSTEIDPDSGRVLGWQYTDPKTGEVHEVSHEDVKLA